MKFESKYEIGQEVFVPYQSDIHTSFKPQLCKIWMIKPFATAQSSNVAYHVESSEMYRGGCEISEQMVFKTYKDCAEYLMSVQK